MNAFKNDPEGYEWARSYAGDSFDQARSVWIETFCEYELDWPLTRFQREIEIAVNAIPTELQHTAKVELESFDGGGAHLTIRYLGPETPEEVTDRINRCENYVAERRMNDKKTYEYLKQKFEKTTT